MEQSVKDEAVEKMLSTLSSGVAPQIVSVLERITEVRTAVKAGTMEDTPVDLHTQLVFNRSQIEQMEVVVAQLTLLKARSENILAEKKGEYDDAYSQAAAKPSFSLGEFASAKEKDAHYSLAATTELFAVRKAEAFHRDVYSAWDYARSLLRGAEATQRDIDTRIRLITLQSNLER